MAFQNPYATRLLEYSSFAFNDDAIFKFGPTRKSEMGWEEHFCVRMGARPESLVFEVGCSNAAFLCEIAKKNPKTAFVGMDWKYKVLFKGAQKIEREKISNVSLLRGRAQDLSQVFCAGDIDELWLFFPDPWAKKGQLKHRLFKEDFLVQAHHHLKPGGRIFFKTDHPGYFQWALALFGQEAPELPEYDVDQKIDRSYRARQVKVRRLESDSLPSVSQKSCELFKLEYFTTDYWSTKSNDLRPSLFSQTKTLFEEVFVREALPIYYLELVKR